MNRDRDTLDRIVARKGRAKAALAYAETAQARVPESALKAETLRIARLELEAAEDAHRRALEMINRR